MNLQQAYQILGISNASSPEEVKKQYRKLSKEYHPDINKAPGAEDHFKQINQAYDTIRSGNEGIPQAWGSSFNPFDAFDVFFSRQSSAKSHIAVDIPVGITLSFKESVQGCKKSISYTRKTKCPHCHGSGAKPIHNGCQKCDGSGQTTSKNGSVVIMQNCVSCFGKRKTENCTTCSASGVVDSQTSVQVSMPEAISDGSVLRLEKVGNYLGSLLGLQDRYSDVLITIEVISDPNLHLVGKDIVSEYSISLLEALSGCKKMVPSLNEQREITIPSGAKNRDEISLMVGDSNNINHRVMIIVEYPTDTGKLIAHLLGDK